MKKKRFCLFLSGGKYDYNVNAMKRLVQFNEHIGKPLSYPCVGLFGIKWQGRDLQKQLNNSIPHYHYSTLESLAYGAWDSKN